MDFWTVLVFNELVRSYKNRKYLMKLYNLYYYGIYVEFKFNDYGNMQTKEQFWLV